MSEEIGILFTDLLKYMQDYKWNYSFMIKSHIVKYSGIGFKGSFLVTWKVAIWMIKYVMNELHIGDIYYLRHFMRGWIVIK